MAIDRKRLVLRLPLSTADRSGFLAQVNRSGRPFIYPTETFYALGCLATNDQAIKQIFQIKKRSTKMPLLVLIGSLEQLQQFCGPLTKAQLIFLETHWPAPLSVILPAKRLSPFLNQQGHDVAFRMTSHTEVRGLIQDSDAPWVGTSANISRMMPFSNFNEVYSQFSPQIGLWLNGGDCPGGKASTLVALHKNGSIQIHRQGAYDISSFP